VTNLKYSERREQIKIVFTKKSEQIKFGECLLPRNSESFVFPLQCKNFKFKMYGGGGGRENLTYHKQKPRTPPLHKTMILPVMLYGC
jgi:hypothetical protein